VEFGKARSRYLVIAPVDTTTVVEALRFKTPMTPDN